MIAFIDNFIFANPWWLLGIPLLLPLFFIIGKKGSPTSITYSSLSILVSLGEKPKRYWGGFSFTSLLTILAIACALIALARPQIKNEFSEQKASGIDIIIAFDISFSMEIQDFFINKRRAKRITASKAATESFIKQRPNDRIGIIAFSGRPYVTSPITLEHDWLVDKLHELNPNMIKEQGTAIGSAIAASATRLNDREAKSKVVIVVTDGSNNAGRIEPIEAAKHASTLGIKIYSIGIGTENGRLPSSFQAQPQQEFDTKTLKEIAQITGGEFFRVKNTDSLENTFASIDELEKTEIKQNTIVNIDELFHWCVGASLLFAILAVTVQSLKPNPAP